MANQAAAAENVADPLEPQVDGAADGADDGDDDGAEPQGGDLRAALAAERGKRKAATQKAKDLEKKVSELQPMADEYGQLLPHLPALLAGAKKPAANPQQVAEVQNARLVKVAEAFGFVDDDGNPDLKRAAAAQGLINETAQAQAETHVAPARRDAAMAQASQIRERAYKAVDNEGNLYAKKEFIDQVFAQMPPEAINNESAAYALVMARGLGGAGESPEREPVFTEGSSRRVGAQALSDVDKRFAKMRGKSDKEWAKLAEDPKVTNNWELE